jgi:hypothetical protein
LVDACVAALDEDDRNELFRKSGILLGDISLDDLGLGMGVKNTNLAYVPITVEKFQHWWTANVVDAGVSTYPVGRCLTDIYTKLLSAILGNECAFGIEGGDVPTSSAKPLVTYFSTPSVGAPRIPLKSPTPFDADSIIPIGRNITEYKEAAFHHYFYLYSEDFIASSKDEVGDRARGVYHFRIGADSGLVKEISFEKIDIKYLHEARYVDMNDRLRGILHERYNVSLTMVGNGLFKPGQMFYINPSMVGMGSSATADAARLLGIGGYYIATHVSSQVNKDRFETTVRGSWVSE